MVSTTPDSPMVQQPEPAEAAAASEAAAPTAVAAAPALGAVASGGITKRGSGGASAEPAPCRTLYARNLDEKRGAKELRALLHALFSPHGEVEWISAHKAIKLRGQAFVTFRDLESATTALRRLQGSMFLDRALQLQYARQQSHRPLGRAASRRVRAGNAAATAAKADANAGADGDANMAAPVPDARAPAPAAVPERLAPNRILFAEQVPPGAALGERCARFAGFVEVRTVPTKPTIAFVEFESEQHAAVAVSALNGSVIADGTEAIKLSYAKK